MVRIFAESKRLRKRWDKTVAWAENVSLPFFDGVPLYDVATFFWKSIVKGSISTRASAIAFSFFVALFPTIIFVFTLIPYIQIKNFQEKLFFLLQQFVPASTFDAIESTIIDIINIQRGELLSFGFAFALIFASNGIAAMMSAFDATIHSMKRRTWFGQRIISILLLMILSVLLTITIALLTFGQFSINYLNDNGYIADGFVFYMITFVKWVVITGLLFFAYAFLYYMAPAKKTKWRFISAGGTVATILSMITFGGFGFYINRFSRYNKLYGSIGTLLIVLLLIYITSYILLLGFELNASIYEARTKSEGLIVVEDDKSDFV